jgi:hypothetical protein
MPQPGPDEHSSDERRRDTQDGADAGPLHHGPPQHGVEDASAAAHAGEPAAHEQPHRPAPPLDAGHHDNSANEKQQLYERIYWAVTGAASIFATLATVVAAIYAVNAYNAALRTVRETRAQVEAVQEANQISSRALAAAVSASIYFDTPIFVQFTDTDGIHKLGLRVLVGNSGGSTTRHLVVRTACVDAEATFGDHFDQARLASAQPYRAPLGPKQVRTPLVCDFSLEKMTGIVAGMRSIYVFGEASYSDTVNPAIPHKVEFCTRLHDFAFGQSWVAGSEACERHNCTDDECNAER